MNEYTFTHLSEDKTNAESICLVYISFLCEAEVPWISCSSVPQSREQRAVGLKWQSKGEMGHTSQPGNLVRPLLGWAGETPSPYGLHLPKQGL